MPIPILSTKLSIPALHPTLVARSRLVQKLNQGLECGFVLVSAPAGYGKTTLLSAWLSKVGYASAWLSLDDRDNDPARFLAYLAAALQKIDPSVGEALGLSLRASPLPDVEMLLTPLVNELAQVDRPFCLVLDDYHLIQSQTVHQLVRGRCPRRSTERIAHRAVVANVNHRQSMFKEVAANPISRLSRVPRDAADRRELANWSNPNRLT